MEQILDSPFQEQRTLQYAGFWIRAAAILIDGFVFGVVYMIGILLVATGLVSLEDPTMAIILLVIFFVAILLYFPLCESSEKQATLGKMAVGIKVGKANGERISFLNALGRFFAKYISQLILYIGYMMAGWDDKKQALHDKIAGTYVFYK
jgi:uncharacterized RDD family membrane protein YckC